MALLESIQKMSSDDLAEFIVDKFGNNLDRVYDEYCDICEYRETCGIDHECVYGFDDINDREVVKKWLTSEKKDDNIIL